VIHVDVPPEHAPDEGERRREIEQLQESRIAKDEREQVQRPVRPQPASVALLGVDAIVGIEEALQEFARERAGDVQDAPLLEFAAARLGDKLGAARTM
jgi:hypothetical protein